MQIPPLPLTAAPATHAPLTIPQHAAGIIHGSADQFLREWCVYGHYYGDDDALIFIGVDRLIDVFQAPDARKNSEWVKMVNPTFALGLRILHTGARSNCFQVRSHIIATSNPKPVCNERGVNIGSRTVIECIETGVRYDTQMECARAVGIGQSSLSAHLAGNPAYSVVRGFTFRRVNKNAPKTGEQ